MASRAAFYRYENTQLLRRFEKKAASGGELPEAALAAVRSRDARQRGSCESLTQPKPYSTKALLNQVTDN
jgi:hypothetical protein